MRVVIIVAMRMECSQSNIQVLKRPTMIKIVGLCFLLSRRIEEASAQENRRSHAVSYLVSLDRGAVGPDSLAECVVRPDAGVVSGVQPGFHQILEGEDGANCVY